MTPEASTLPDSTSLMDLDETFLPVGQMRQIARVTLVEKDTIEGEVELGPDHWVYPQHFPGDPIFPGTLMIEGAGQLIALGLGPGAGTSPVGAHQRRVSQSGELRLLPSRP